MSLYLALYTVENNKNKKPFKFQGDMLIFCDIIPVYVFTTNHQLKETIKGPLENFTIKNYNVSLTIGSRVVKHQNTEM